MTRRLTAIFLALLLALGMMSIAAAEDGYPIEGDWEITIWCPLSALISPYVTNAAETPAIQELCRVTGVKLNFIHPTTGQEKENFNLLIAGGDIPDIMYTSQYAGGNTMGVDDGVYADLTDLVEQYMPHYYHYLSNDDEFRKLSTTEDGRVIAIYNYKDMVEPFWWRTQFRADLLEEFGMDEPCTIAEYEAFFDKVLETHPEITPFSLPNDGLNGAFMCAWDFGIIQQSRTADFYLEGDHAQSGYYAEGMYDYLKLMHDWYEKGYISKDFMSEDPTTLFQTGKVACVTGNGYEMYPTCNELGIPITCGPYARVNEGDKIHTLRHYWHNNAAETFVSGKVKGEKLEVILKFLDYGYTEEGILTYNFGTEGFTWDEVDENGYPIYNDFMLNNENYPIANAEAMLKVHAYAVPRWRYGDGICMATNQKNPDNWAYRARWGDDPDVDDSYGLPPFVLDADASERRAEIMNNVETHAKEMVLKYITGAADLANFDTEYTQVLKDFGVEEAIEITQAGYEAYLAK
ncbi:MAG: extracellular solute-binding protein [Clostridia bacterium]|nr:extracellular solute-binding protein [Clostridia bacterium]